MKKILGMFGALLTVFLAACSASPSPVDLETQASSWRFVGANLDVNLNNGFGGSQLAISRTNKLAVAWQETFPVGGDFDYGIYVKRWNGSTWQQLGGSLDSKSVSFASTTSLSVDLDNANNPFVAWSKCVSEVSGFCNNDDIFVKAWTGSTWQLLGGALDTTLGEEAFSPSLVVGTDNKPVVAWHEDAGGIDSCCSNPNVYVKRWDGSNWIALGGALDVNVANSAVTPSLALDAANHPVVAWMESSSGSPTQLYVKRWNGSTWQQLGSSLNVSPTSYTFNPSLALDNSGNPYVAFEQRLGNTGSDVYVKRWDGSQWLQVGGSLDVVSFRRAYEPSLAIDKNNTPSVAFLERRSSSNYDLYVKRWDGTQWAQVGKAVETPSTESGRKPSLVVNSNNVLFVSFEQSLNPFADGHDLYVKRY
jgi:hypothetical protein